MKEYNWLTKEHEYSIFTIYRGIEGGLDRSAESGWSHVGKVILGKDTRKFQQFISTTYVNSPKGCQKVPKGSQIVRARNNNVRART